MKCIIQIPCWNEEENLAATLDSLPRTIEGIDRLEVQIVDDGSTDNTVAVAQRWGVDHIIRLSAHEGLAHAFSRGVTAALARGADILVNTDADLQYHSGHIERLLKPVCANQADMVVGNRLQNRPRPFGPVKMTLEHAGSWVVRRLSGVGVADAACGFRAFNRRAMQSMFIHGNFSYTLESLLLAGTRGLRVANVPVGVNPPRRGSRLFSSVDAYVRESAVTIIRAYLMYHPLRFFAWFGVLFLVAAGVLGVRFLYFLVSTGGDGHVQSLILLAILAFLGFQSLVLGLIGDVIAANRRLLEEVRQKTTLLAACGGENREGSGAVVPEEAT